jgi:hypothetical protein
MLLLTIVLSCLLSVEANKIPTLTAGGNVTMTMFQKDNCTSSSNKTILCYHQPKVEGNGVWSDCVSEAAGLSGQENPLKGGYRAFSMHCSSLLFQAFPGYGGYVHCFSDNACKVSVGEASLCFHQKWKASGTCGSSSTPFCLGFVDFGTERYVSSTWEF